MNAILAELPQNDWGGKCINNLLKATNLTEGLVNGEGKPVFKFDANAWGINYTTCERYCNRSAIPTYFDFNTFSDGATSYLLPWLALTAQLPYETGSSFGDVMSFCLAVGSPALITFSLTLTILNRYWIQERFEELHEKYRGGLVIDNYRDFGGLIRNTQYFLQEAQQVSIRVSQANGWLSSLVVLPQNQQWWENLRSRLATSRRDRTASLFWQMGVAIITYILTTASSFLAVLGSADSALRIASGTLWLWLLPVIAGWVLVGTQIGPKSIPDALRAEKAYLAKQPSPDGPILETEYQKFPQEGLKLDSHFTHQLNPEGQLDRERGFTRDDEQRLTPPTCLLANVPGDERRAGPIYNYARIFTWYSLSTSIYDAIDATLDNIARENVPHGQIHSSNSSPRLTLDFSHSQTDIPLHPTVPQSSHSLGSSRRQQSQDTAVSSRWNHKRRPSVNLAGDTLEIAQYCRLGNAKERKILAYPSMNTIPPRLIGHVAFASFMALFIQWGTTGPAIWIAYKTPSPGLGCRSGGYLFYGSLSIVVWGLLATSMLLSHWSMLIYQEEHMKTPLVDFRKSRRQGKHALLCVAAVMTRRLGKTIAVLNAVWIILSSIFELIGLYESCWCNANVLGLRYSGWVLLFKQATDLKSAALGPWAGGVTVAGVTWAVSGLVFYYGTKSDSGK